VGAGLPLPLKLCHSTFAGLHLRRLSIADAATFHAAVTTPEIGRMLTMFPAYWSLTEAESHIRALAPRESAPFRLAIDPGDGRFLGAVGLVRAEPAELSFFLVPECQGKRVMQAALAGFVPMLFRQFDLPALHAQAYHDNPASMALLRRAGFVETGTQVGTCSAQRTGAETLHRFVLKRA